MSATWFEMGEKKGKVEGKVEGLLTAISAVLEVKFGEAGLAFADQLAHVTDISMLAALLASSKKASSLEELRPLLN